MSLHFETWVYLLGAASAIVPLILHLSHVQHKKHMRFSTTRFFTEAIRRAQRRLRIKQWLLLLLRMAVCFFLAVALAGPFFRTSGAAPFNPSRDVAVILDDSCSMGYREGDQTRFAKAQQAAANLVRTLDEDDRVAVVFTSGRQSLSAPELSTDRDQALRRIAEAAVMPLAADVRAAFEQATRLFKVSDSTAKEVHFFTDQQRSAWTRLAEIIPDVPMALFVVNCGAGPVRNLSIGGLEIEGGAPMVGVPVIIKVHVRNHGAEDQAGQVTLLEETEPGKPEKIGGPAAVSVRGAFTQIVRFQHTFTKGGRHRLQVQLGPDNLAIDNDYYAFVHVMDKVPVLVVDGDPSDIKHMAETFFLQTALDSFRAERAAIETTVVRVAETANRHFSTYRLIVLANVPAAEVRVVSRLEDYVESGGALLVFLGDAVDTNWYNTYLAGPDRRYGGLLPGRLGPVKGDPQSRQQTLAITWYDPGHPALARFKDPTSANLGQPKFYAAYDVETGVPSVASQTQAQGQTQPTAATQPSPGASVLMRLKDGTPLLVERPFGRGRVMLFTSSCDLGWNNLPVRALYVPLVHQLVAYLTQQQAVDPSHPVGRAVVLAGDTWDRQQPITVTAPHRKTYTIEASADPKGQEAPAVFDQTLVPGFYKAVVPQKEDKPVIEEFAVNPAAEESDLTPIGEEEIRELMGEGKRVSVSLVEAPEKLPDAIRKASAELRFWEVVMLVVLVMALAEPFLANLLTALGGPRQAARTPT